MNCTWDVSKPRTSKPRTSKPRAAKPSGLVALASWMALVLLAVPATAQLIHTNPLEKVPEPARNEKGQLDTLVFTASDSLRATQLTDLLHLYLDPAENRSGQTLLNAGGGLSWLEFSTRGLPPLGAVGTTNVLSGLSFTLRIDRMDPDGYVFQWFNGPFWPFPDYTHSGGRLVGWEFNAPGNTQGWTQFNIRPRRRRTAAGP